MFALRGKLSIFLLFVICLVVFFSCGFSQDTSEVIKYVENEDELSQCEGKCGIMAQDADSVITQLEINPGPNRISTHIYTLAGYGIALIPAGASLAQLFTTVTVELKNGHPPGFEFCQSGGFGFRDENGLFYNINTRFEVQNGKSCSVTATKDVVQLATEGTRWVLQQELLNMIMPTGG